MADGAIPAERRVKLYLCNPEGQWEDQGTGYVTIVKGQAGRFNIVMRSETEKDSDGNYAVVLNTPLSMNDIYEVQRETLIVWEDPFMAQHLALSFQVPSGCIATAEAMKAIQQGQVDTDDEPEPEPIYLPEPEITSLGTLLQTLTRVTALSLRVRRDFACHVAENGFLEKLFVIFDQCEDLDDVDSLHILFRIFIAIILLNDAHVLSILFAPQNIMKLMGALEYDPVFQRRLNHRQYLQTIVQFREAVQLKPALKAKIHETFKLQYFKDSVVTRFLDDATAGTLNGMVIGKQTDIIGEICHDDDVMDEALKIISEGSVEDKIQVLRMVQEMQTFAKNLIPKGRAEFLANLCANGILRSISELMVSPEPTVRRLAVDIISQSTQHEPGVLRGFIVDEEEKGSGCPLLSNVVQRLVADSPDSERVEMVEILRQLLETGQKQIVQPLEQAVVTAPEEMAQLLHIFYTTCMPVAIKPLLKEPDASIASAFHLVDLLSFCISQHGESSKRMVLQHGLIAKVTALLLSPFCTMHLAAALVRFLKAVVATREEAYCRHLVQANTFRVVIDLLIRNRERYNLLYSTILAIFEVIRRENIKVLIGHLAETFAEALQPLLQLDTIAGLQRQWALMKAQDKEAVREALRQPADVPEEPAVPQPDGRDPLVDGSPAPTSPVSLVAYGEEDDPDARAAKKRKVAEMVEASADVAT